MELRLHPKVIKDSVSVQYIYMQLQIFLPTFGSKSFTNNFSPCLKDAQALQGELIIGLQGCAQPWGPSRSGTFPGGLQGVGLLQGANTIHLIWGRTQSALFCRILLQNEYFIRLCKYNFFRGIRVPPGCSGCSRPHTSSRDCWMWPWILMWPSLGPKTI